MKKVYIIENLDCANCAAKIEAKFNAHPQVVDVRILIALDCNCVKFRFVSEFAAH